MQQERDLRENLKLATGALNLLCSLCINVQYMSYVPSMHRRFFFFYLCVVTTYNHFDYILFMVSFFDDYCKSPFTSPFLLFFFFFFARSLFCKSNRSNNVNNNFENTCLA